ncbi:MAG: hypothetical protein O7E57_02010 [Gammaproteobacteria bacterium]|nr:hypothetical protein [Gammaproteobacteria bacterium]
MRTVAMILATFVAFSAQAQPGGSFPEVGQRVPDLELVTDEGTPANLRELTRGHYTVLILGCLT